MYGHKGFMYLRLRAGAYKSKRQAEHVQKPARQAAGKAGATRDTSSFVNEIHVPSRILLLDVSFAVP